MALVVEDDTGLSDAEAYISVADSDAYVVEVYGTSQTLWDAATDAVKEQVLRQATRYLDQHYKYVGIRLTTTQALEWPRTDAQERTSTFEFIDGVHIRIKDASVELALMVINGTTLFPITVEGGNTKSVTVGPIEKVFSEKQVNREPIFHLINNLVRYLIVSGNAIIRS